MFENFKRRRVDLRFNRLQADLKRWEEIVSEYSMRLVLCPLEQRDELDHLHHLSVVEMMRVKREILTISFPEARVI